MVDQAFSRELSPPIRHRYGDTSHTSVMIVVVCNSNARVTNYIIVNRKQYHNLNANTDNNALMPQRNHGYTRIYMPPC